MKSEKFKMTGYFSLLIIIVLFTACNQKENNKASALEMTSYDDNKAIELIRNDEEKRVDIFIDGHFFTSYIYPETIDKPVLYPIKAAKGAIITRGFPIDSRPGERIDHPHHIGLWFNYGDVNGLDFWNNSSAIPPDKKHAYGSIIHKSIQKVSSGKDKGELQVRMEWVDHQGEILLEENTTFIFRGTDDRRMIDRITKLTALDKKVSMKDNKEGLIGIRVARELEHPSDKPLIFTDASGKATGVPAMNNEGVTGMYRSSEGLKGHDVWGTRGKWMNLSGRINGQNVSVAILDHPDNVGYPTYWHARGYGLYAANPLGQKEMSGDKEELNFELPKRESVTFKHRIIIYSGTEDPGDQIDKDFTEFAL